VAETRKKMQGITKFKFPITRSTFKLRSFTNRRNTIMRKSTPRNCSLSSLHTIRAEAIDRVQPAMHIRSDPHSRHCYERDLHGLRYSGNLSCQRSTNAWLLEREITFLGLELREREFLADTTQLQRFSNSLYVCLSDTTKDPKSELVFSKICSLM
jgi:hypothetical protein